MKLISASVWRVVWSVGSDDPLAPGVRHLALAGPGETVVSADDGGALVARRVEDGAAVGRPVESGLSGVLALAAWVDAAGPRAATGAGTLHVSHRWLRRWDLAAGREIEPGLRLSIPLLRHLVAGSVGGERVLVYIDRRLQVVRAVDGVLLGAVGPEDLGHVSLVAGLLDGEPVVVVSATGHGPDVFRLSALGERPRRVPTGVGVYVVAMDGPRLVAAPYGERHGRAGWRTVWAVGVDGKRLGPDVGGEPITSLAIAGWPVAYIARSDGSVARIDLETGRDLAPLLRLPVAARAVAAAPGGDLLVAAGSTVARIAPPRDG